MPAGIPGIAGLRSHTDPMTEPRARETVGRDIIDAARELGICGDQLKELAGRVKEMM